MHQRARLASRAPTAMREDSHEGQPGASGSTFTSPQEAHPRARRQVLQTPLSTSNNLFHIEHCFLRPCFRCSYSSGNLAAKHALQNPLKPDCAATRCFLGWLPAHQPAAGVFGGIKRNNCRSLRWHEKYKEALEALPTCNIDPHSWAIQNGGQ